MRTTILSPPELSNWRHYDHKPNGLEPCQATQDEDKEEAEEDVNEAALLEAVIT